MIDIRTLDLAALNSATKYPPIFTYHELDPKNGNLLDEVTAFTGDVHLTEKVDGTNARIISFPDGSYILGSREELLHARGDLILNPKLGIVDSLRSLADRITPPGAGIRVHYLEVYGGKVGSASRQYTGDLTIGHRLFDVAEIPLNVLDQPLASISSWRENSGQRYLAEDELARLAKTEGVEMTPRLATAEANTLPRDIDGMLAFLRGHLPTTRVALDDGAGGRPEGIVLRTSDRSVIAKARFADYERTIKRRAKR
ncbi:RNA ligase family protein [Streptomyces sp. Edi2]|uniref:RNA ligase family protein n=1 Tax=Streptomyces sp. Edi2 TaxID=3162528 RepID=UPI0033059023